MVDWMIKGALTNIFLKQSILFEYPSCFLIFILRMTIYADSKKFLRLLSSYKLNLRGALKYTIFAVVILQGCKDGFRQVLDSQLEEQSSIYLEGFTRQSTGLDGNSKWFIHAQKAFVYMEGSEQKRLIVYDFKFIEYDKKGKMRNTIVAKRGEIDYTQGALFLKGQVISTNQAGRVVKSEKMKFDIEEKVFTSDSRVEILDVNTYLLCSAGARIEVESNKQICKGPTVVKKRNKRTSKNEDESTDLDIFQ